MKPRKKFGKEITKIEKSAALYTSILGRLMNFISLGN